MRMLVLAALMTALVPAATVLANEGGERVTFGQDVLVAAGERVEDVVTFGGDAVIDGTVTGDVLTMGGDVVVTGRVRGDVATMGGDAAVSGNVGGDVATMGGDLSLMEGARVRGETVVAGGHITVAPGVDVSGHGVSVNIDPGAGMLGIAGLGAAGAAAGVGAWLIEALGGAVSFGMLFLLGLVLMGVWSERFAALQVTIVRHPGRAGALGLAAFVASAIGILILAVTIIGIPVAVIAALLLPLVAYVGLAASASVIGAAIPISSLRGKPVLQLGAGVLCLFIASLLPVVGIMIVATASCLGVGALVMTRCRNVAPPKDTTPAGPYRTAAA